MMRDLDLFEQYLVRLRHEKLQAAHAAALGASALEVLLDIKARASEAELTTRILGALKVLTKDSGDFIKAYLQ